MSAALATLPWVEKDAIRTNAPQRLQVTFGFKNKSDFNLDEVKQAVKNKAGYTVSRLVKGP